MNDLSPKNRKKLLPREKKFPLSPIYARFTLIELLVTAAQQNCFSKIKNYTSLLDSEGK